MKETEGEEEGKDERKRSVKWKIMRERVTEKGQKKEKKKEKAMEIIGLGTTICEVQIIGDVNGLLNSAYCVLDPESIQRIQYIIQHKI